MKSSYRTVSALLLVGSCGTQAAGGAETVRDLGAPINAACTLEASNEWFRYTSLVDFSFQPLQGDAMVHAAPLIIRGRVTAIGPGRTIDFASGASNRQLTTLLTVAVDETYKTSDASSAQLFVEVPRSPEVDAAAFTRLGSTLPKDAITLFLTPAQRDETRLRYSDEPKLPDGARLHALRTPQGLIVASPCGLRQPFARDAPIFMEDIESDTLLAEAVREAVASRRLAHACDSEPGAPTDVSSEPPVRQYADYQPWTDGRGCLLRIDVLVDRPGPSHCNLQGIRVIIGGAPLGTRYAADTRHEYVRDPEGVLGNPTLTSLFQARATLPAEARDTGFRLGDVALWEGDSFIYLVGPHGIERWPLAGGTRGSVPLCG